MAGLRGLSRGEGQEGLVGDKGSGPQISPSLTVELLVRSALLGRLAEKPVPKNRLWGIQVWMVLSLVVVYSSSLRHKCC